MTMTARATTPTDIKIGAQIRALRSIAKMTQAELGERLGVSFQQIQKYEKGMNRIGGARLVQIAKALKTSVGALTETEHLQSGNADQVLREFLLSPEGRTIIGAFAELDEPMRRAVAQLASNLAEQHPAVLRAETRQ